jgi:hypothetical protein
MEEKVRFTHLSCDEYISGPSHVIDDLSQLSIGSALDIKIGRYDRLRSE